ncbi:MOSC domain-containing protein [Limnohabitans sp. Hippo3]|uniref:MOSC domain-containing protein n=1 Tax=Limnohabitans sp. Hippo3 TaxID=1597956 RepID=UPI000D36A19C|nr:MOSC domain-containing protein [Limnohabitans sp. Hippo3]PUE38791.1 sulfurase [Limnohabitans sp. Hippo3]
MPPSSPPGFSGTLLAIQTGRVRPLVVGGRKLMSAIGKTTVAGPIEVGVLGLAGDEQADLSVHGGLGKAVYALPSEHLPWWQAQRQAQGVTMFDEALAPGFLGENLSLQGVLEQDLFVGDCLDFGDVVLRVTQPREPCGKFNAVMGYAQAAKDMVQSGRCGFYLAVDQPGRLQAGASFQIIPGQRSVSVAQALQHKAWKHLR